MKNLLQSSRRCLALLAVCGISLTSAKAQVSYSQLNSTYTQDFNTLAISGTPAWQDNVTLAGWYAYMSKTGTPAAYSSSTGSSSAGQPLKSFYSSSNSADRALGFAPGTTPGDTMVALRLTNTTGQVITQMTIGYKGEEWRIVGTGPKSMTVAYQIGTPSNLASGTWTEIPDLTFDAPVTSPAGTALDGTLEANSALLSTTVIGLNWESGTDLYIRFFEKNDAANKHFALDNFTFSATAIPEGRTVGMLMIGGLAVGGGMLLNRKGRTPRSEPVFRK